MRCLRESCFLCTAWQLNRMGCLAPQNFDAAMPCMILVKPAAYSSMHILRTALGLRQASFALWQFVAHLHDADTEMGTRSCKQEEPYT